MPSINKFQSAISIGEDSDIDRFFVGRDMELKRALAAITLRCFNQCRSGIT
jgi:hypothetical protein